MLITKKSRLIAPLFILLLVSSCKDFTIRSSTTAPSNGPLTPPGGDIAKSNPTKSISYNMSSFVFELNQAIPTANQPTPSYIGGAPTQYSITLGTLPTGLTFDTKKGIISGTPTAEMKPAGSFTISAGNSDNKGALVNTQIQITASANPIPSIIVDNTKLIQGGVAKFSISSVFKNPLIIKSFESSDSTNFSFIDTDSCVGKSLNLSNPACIVTVTFNPQSPSGSYNYYFKLGFNNGDTDTSVQSINIAGITTNSSTISYSVSSPIFQQNQTPVSMIPSYTGSGVPNKYSMDPNTLVADTGLTFDPTSGKISGSPTLAHAETKYKVSAIDATSKLLGATDLIITVQKQLTCPGDGVTVPNDAWDSPEVPNAPQVQLTASYQITAVNYNDTNHSIYCTYSIPLFPQNGTSYNKLISKGVGFTNPISVSSNKSSWSKVGFGNDSECVPSADIKNCYFYLTPSIPPALMKK